MFDASTDLHPSARRLENKGSMITPEGNLGMLRLVSFLVGEMWLRWS